LGAARDDPGSTVSAAAPTDSRSACGRGTTGDVSRDIDADTAPNPRANEINGGRSRTSGTTSGGTTSEPIPLGGAVRAGRERPCDSANHAGYGAGHRGQSTLRPVRPIGSSGTTCATCATCTNRDREGFTGDDASACGCRPAFIPTDTTPATTSGRAARIATATTGST
jgi:hypothetical protein